MIRALSRPRWKALAAATALLAAVAGGAAAPALAAAPAQAAAHASSPPPLDAAALRGVVDGLPGDDLTGVLVRITGSAGQWSGTSGAGDLSTGAPVRADGSFRIGSISKVFTATVVLQLAAEHRLDVDDAVQSYLPGLLPAAYPKITIGQLLNHTSGLPSRGGEEFWGDGTNQWFVDHRFESWSPERIVTTLVRGREMEYPPGTAQTYSGINTFVAGLIVEKVTGHSFAREVRDRIARPLGLRHTYVPAIDDARLPGPAAHGYLTVTAKDGTAARADVTQQAAWPWAEGGMISTAAELDRFMGALYRGRLLPPAQQRLLFSVPDVPNHRNKNCEYGDNRACFSMGLIRGALEDGTEVWGKTGSRPGYTSGMFATRDLSRRLVYSVNPTGLGGAESSSVMKLVTTVFGPLAQTRSNGSA